MSSKQLLLAFSSKRPMTDREFAVRLRHATEHLSKVLKSDLTVATARVGNNGILGWSLPSDPVDWPVLSTDRDGSHGWLYTPSPSAFVNARSDRSRLAFDITSNRIERWKAGAPLACVTLNPLGELRVSNDVLGMARIYRYTFKGMTVWSSRQGLAHVFAAELPEVNIESWHSMATLGWPTLGTTLVGFGVQLSGNTLEIAAPGVRYRRTPRWGIG